MYSSTPPSPHGGSSIVIDCQSCPVRDRHCGDCFVPVLGRLWLSDPLSADRRPGGSAHQHEDRSEHPPRDAGQARAGERLDPDVDATAGLDSDELAAVSAFVRAGLVSPQEGTSARASVDITTRWAVG